MFALMSSLFHRRGMCRVSASSGEVRHPRIRAYRIAAWGHPPVVFEHCDKVSRSAEKAEREHVKPNLDLPVSMALILPGSDSAWLRMRNS